MIQAIQKTILSFGVCYFAFLVNPSSLIALSEELRIEPGGYLFTSTFVLHDSLRSSDLPLKMTVARGTSLGQCVDGPISPHELVIYLYCEIQGENRLVGILPKSKGRYKFIKMSVPSASKWRNTLKDLAKKAAANFYTADSRKMILHPKLQAVRFATKQKILIKRRPHCTLKTTYAVRNVAMPSLFRRYPKRILVDVLIKTRKKNELVAIAKFYEKDAQKTSKHQSVIKFIRMKNEIQEISRKNILPSSGWYEGVKEVVARSMKRYLRFMSVQKKRLAVNNAKDTFVLEGKYLFPSGDTE